MLSRTIAKTVPSQRYTGESRIALTSSCGAWANASVGTRSRTTQHVSRKRAWPSVLCRVVILLWFYKQVRLFVCITASNSAVEPITIVAFTFSQTSPCIYDQLVFYHSRFNQTAEQRVSGNDNVRAIRI